MVRASRHGVAAAAFDLNQEAARGDAEELSFQLPDRFGPIRLQRHSFETRGARDGVWRGSAENRGDSSVLLTFHEGFVAGTVRVGEELYEIRPTADGEVVEKVDISTFGACGGTPDAPVPEAAAADASVNGAAAAPEAQFDAAGAYVIDLLSVYTPQARAAAGGASQIAATIQAAVDAANTAFANSGVNIAYRLLRTAEVAHNDAGDINVDLAWLAGDATTIALRNEVGADLVSLVVENGAGYCGIGYAMRSPGPGFANAAVQVTARSCAVSNLSLAHEHGHNLGMEHDPANGPPASAASYPWSFGYLVNGVFRTVMSYSTECPNGCTRLPYFSNPNVTYQGYPTGVANAADNARTANLTAPIVAAFRTAPSSPTAPTTPGSLGATAVSTSQINLSWADLSSNETGFRLERSQGGGAFGLIATLGANVTSYQDTGLAASTQYTYRVRSYNSVGDSSNSNTASATTQTAPAGPKAPTGLSATAASASQINLSWADNSTEEEGFRIERAVSGGSFVEITIVRAGSVSYADTGLTANTGYTYRVRAFNNSGNSAYTNTASATTQSAATAPSAPTGLSANAVSQTQINLSWADGSNNESGFRIERSSGGSGFAEIATVGAGVTSYASTGLTAGTAYTYRVRAYSANGNSGYSNTASATTQSASSSAPNAPSGFTGTPNFFGSGTSRFLISIRLNWSDVGRETGYRIEKCKAASVSASCTYSAFRTVSANTSFSTDSNVFASGNGIYKYRIRAENASGNSAWVETTVNAQ